MVIGVRSFELHLAAAHSLIELGDPLGYNVYYAILIGERKSGQGLLDKQKKMLSDPKKMARFGFEQGIGFVPFASIGYNAFTLPARRSAGGSTPGEKKSPKIREESALTRAHIDSGTAALERGTWPTRK